MSAATLLATLQSEGFTFEADGTRLLVSPAEALTPALSDAIRAAKPAIMELLAATPPPDPRIPPGYVVTIRGFMSRWVALGRPVLLMPRRLGIGAPYVVDDLGDWFTTYSLADPPANGWGPRKPEEIALLDAVLTELEGRTPTNTAPSGACIRCGDATVAPTFWHCRRCLDAATNDKQGDEI